VPLPVCRGFPRFFSPISRMIVVFLTLSFFFLPSSVTSGGIVSRKVLRPLARPPQGVPPVNGLLARRFKGTTLAFMLSVEKNRFCLPAQSSQPSALTSLCPNLGKSAFYLSLPARFFAFFRLR